MKQENRKRMMIVICMLAAGISYGFLRWDGGYAEKNRQDQTIREEIGAELTDWATDEMEKPGAESAQDREEIDATDGGSICYVQICGQVVRPGVYEVPEGSRVFWVVELAGGFTPEAADQYLNMAQTVEDGMKLVVPSAGELNGAQLYGGQTTGELAPAKVNLNTAGKEELMGLKGIGEAKAEDIIRYRKEQGPFRRIEDIMNISGIKEAAFQKIKDDITV